MTLRGWLSEPLMLKYHSENSPQKLWLASSFGFQKIRYYCTASAILIKSNARAKITSLEWLKGGVQKTPTTCGLGSDLCSWVISQA